MRKISWLLFVCLNALGQASFEVASIKPHPGIITYSADPSPKGDRVVGVASTLIDMITTAYNVRYDQISGGPDWTKSDHFDLEAKASAPITRAQMRPLLQALLGERFKLQIHRETKEVPMYALVVAKGGAKLHQPNEENRGDIRVGPDAIMHLTVSKGTMAQLAERLSSNGAGRPVMDRTGLTGAYSFKLDWINGTPGIDAAAPSLFVALEEQLGLKLEPIKGPGEVIVIDHAEKPTAN